jgi:hypothetical protein
MKKAYKSPEIAQGAYAPLILDVQPGSYKGGEYHDGMSIDARRRNRLEDIEDEYVDIFSSNEKSTESIYP